MPQLGIAIYPEKVGREATMKYLELAARNGFKRIFANLIELVNNEEGQAKLKELKAIYHYARELGMEVIVDVNPNLYQAFDLEISETAFFANLGASGIRLDESYDGNVEAKLSKNEDNLKIELNASTSTKIIDLALAKGAKAENLIACHNFYPMRHTGLSRDRFIAFSSHFKAKNVRVAAFVSLQPNKNVIGPWNVNHGMPTLESHRDLPLEEQVSDLLALEIVDDIIIAQQGATEEQMQKMQQALKTYLQVKKSQKVVLPLFTINDLNNTEQEILFVNKQKLHHNRPDYNDNFVRSTFSRIDFADCQIKPHYSKRNLKIGDVVVLNENLGRYKGEVHIITKPLFDQENGRNYVGKIDQNQIILLKYLRDDIEFSFIKKEHHGTN